MSYLIIQIKKTTYYLLYKNINWKESFFFHSFVSKNFYKLTKFSKLTKNSNIVNKIFLTAYILSSKITNNLIFELFISVKM